MHSETISSPPASGAGRAFPESKADRRLPWGAAAGWCGLGALALLGRWSELALWVAAVVLVGGHEAGHALAARRCGYAVPRVVIGCGPTIVGFRIGPTAVRLGLLPVFGLADIDTVDDDTDHPLRSALVYLAGPLASLALGFVLIFGALVGPGIDAASPVSAARAASEVTVRSAGAVWAAPYHWVNGAIRRFVDPEPSRSAGGEGRERPTGDDGDPRLVSAVGIAAEVSRSGDDLGIRGGLFLTGGVSAGIAGFNLLPVWGLDGFGILEACVRGLRRRHRGIGRFASRALVATGILMAVVAVGLITFTVGRDLAALV